MLLLIFSLWNNQQIKGKDCQSNWVNVFTKQILYYYMKCVILTFSTWSRTGRTWQRLWQFIVVVTLVVVLVWYGVFLVWYCFFVCLFFCFFSPLWPVQNVVLCLSEFLEGHNKIIFTVVETWKKNPLYLFNPGWKAVIF